MERIGGVDTGMPTSIRKVVVASFIGTTIEWYDYFIFATAALFPIGGAILISVCIAVLCALSVLCYLLADETYRKDIYEKNPAERRLVAEQQGLTS